MVKKNKKQIKKCLVCGKKLNRFPEQYTCSKECYIRYHHKGYYDLDGTLKFSDRIYKKN